MSMELVAPGAVDQRECERFAHVGVLEYRYGLDEQGLAAWHDVSRDGVCVQLGRYLRPGRSIVVVRAQRELHDEPLELKGRVAWCRPAGDDESYLVGIKIHRSGVELCHAMWSLVREALKNTFSQLAEDKRNW